MTQSTGNNDKGCELCTRETELTEHHLIPKTLHTKKWYRKNYDLDFLKNHVIMLCHDCHNAIHKFIDVKDMGKNYNTLEKLKKHEQVKKFCEWVKSQDKKAKKVKT